MSSFDIPPILRICKKKDNDNSSSYIKKYCISALLSEKITLTFEKDLFINEFRIGLAKTSIKRHYIKYVFTY